MNAAAGGPVLQTREGGDSTPQLQIQHNRIEVIVWSTSNYTPVVVDALLLVGRRTRDSEPT